MTAPEVAIPGLANPVLLGIVGAAHGIAGEVRVKSFTEDPLDLSAYGPLFDRQARRWTVKKRRVAKNALVVRFAEIADRNAAEALRGTHLFVDRSALPKLDPVSGKESDTAEEETYYQADLIGLTAIDSEGLPIGAVTAVHNFGADDILEITGADRSVRLIPFTRLAVPGIDMDGRTLTVDPGAAGLVGSDEPDEEPGGEGR